MTDYRYVTYELLDDGKIARIMLDRPRSRNAQNRGLLIDLNAALLEAEADDAVKAVVMSGKAFAALE